MKYLILDEAPQVGDFAINPNAPNAIPRMVEKAENGAIGMKVENGWFEWLPLRDYHKKVEIAGDLPRPYVNVMITYKAYVGYGPYGDRMVLETVTRRAFYTDSDGYYNSKDEWVETPNGYFCVPQFWTNFYWHDGTVTIQPKSFHHLGRPRPEDIIDWEYDKTKEL